MLIDGRSADVKEVLKQLKQILYSACGVEVDVEVLAQTEKEAHKVKAFASMSGCKVSIEKKEGCFIIQIKGIPCCT